MAAAGPRLSRSLTTWSLAALAVGLALGAFAHASGGSGFRTLAAALQPIGDLWLTALRMTVLPLVIAYTLAAIVGARQDGLVGATAARAVLLFLLMLIAAGLLTLALAPALVSLHPVDPAAAEAIRSQTPIPEAARAAASAGRRSVEDFLPQNLFQAAVAGDIFPLLLFSAVFGLAVTRLPDEQREPLTAIFRGLAAAMLVCVRWVLLLMPVGVFVFTFRFAFASGLHAIRAMGAYVGIVSGLMLLCTVLLYPVTSLLGRTGLRQFARAVAPAQLIGVTTRSSIASLPALIQGARERLRLPDSSTGLVLPLSVSVFKLDLTVSNTVKLVFLAHVYGVPLTAGPVAMFLLYVIFLSFSSPGLPSGGTFRTLPAYLAFGVPIEGVVMVQAAEAIPDIFMTLLNVTADMSAATLLSRSSRARAEIGAAAR